MNVVKPLLIVGSGGTLATGAYLTKGYWMASPSSKEAKVPKIELKKSISQILTDNKYIPLDPATSASGNDVLEKYNKVYSSATKETSQLQSYCRSLLAKDEFGDADYKEARRGCVTPQSVTQRLGLFNKNPLSTDDPGTTNDNEGKQKISGHNQATSNKLTYVFNGQEDQDLKGIKAECKILNAKTNDAESFEDDFSKSLKWCAINA